jgi:hypothetical protein
LHRDRSFRTVRCLLHDNSDRCSPTDVTFNVKNCADPTRSFAHVPEPVSAVRSDFVGVETDSIVHHGKTNEVCAQIELK